MGTHTFHVSLIIYALHVDDNHTYNYIMGLDDCLEWRILKNSI